MNIYEFFEESNLEQAYKNEQFVYQAAESIPDLDLVRVANTWLRGISNQHQVPGRPVLVIANVCDYYQEHKHLTNRQRIYLIAHLIQYWDQMTLQARAQLML